MRTVILAAIVTAFSWSVFAEERRESLEMRGEILSAILPRAVEGLPRDQQLKVLKEKYKVWGAIAYAKTGTHQRDITVTGVILNQHGWKTARDKAYRECVERKIGPCSVATFPGCLFINIGRKFDERVPIYGISPAPDHLMQECKTKGFQCTPPIGGCNYLDEKGNNGYTHNSDKSPLVPDYAQWILEIEQ